MKGQNLMRTRTLQGHCKVGEGCPTLRAVSKAKNPLLKKYEQQTFRLRSR